MGTISEFGSTFVGFGTLTVDPGAVWTLSGQFDGVAAVTVGKGADLSVSGDGLISGLIVGAGALQLSGMFAADGAAISVASLNLSPSSTLSGFGALRSGVTVGGTLLADAGILDLRGSSLANLISTTLAGGTFIAATGSTLQLPNNASVVTDAATIVIGGTNAVNQSYSTSTGQNLPLQDTLATIASGGAST